MSNGNSIQKDFVGILKEKNVPVAVYLTNGIKLQGVISDFDADLIMLKNKANIHQVVYKHAIASILPMRNPDENMAVDHRHAYDMAFETA